MEQPKVELLSLVYKANDGQQQCAWRLLVGFLISRTGFVHVNFYLVFTFICDKRWILKEMHTEVDYSMAFC